MFVIKSWDTMDPEEISKELKLNTISQLHSLVGKLRRAGIPIRKRGRKGVLVRIINDIKNELNIQ